MRLVIDDVWLKSPDFVLPNDVSYMAAAELKTTSVPCIGSVYGVLHNDVRGLLALGDAVNQAPYKKAPIAPVLYNKPRNTWVENAQPIIAPKNVGELQMGGALGIVMGDVATRLNLNNALSVVAGYTIVNDVSVPHEAYYRPSLRFKVFDASCAIGPWVRGAVRIPNPDALMVHTYVNDELVQEYNTMIFTRGVAQLLVDVTEFMTLQPNDILILGVAHPPVLGKIGDTVRIEIEHLGVLINTVKEDR